MEYKIISWNELNDLLRDSEKLRRLEDLGVDNWNGYDLAMSGDYEFDKSFLDWEEEELHKIVDSYLTYNFDY